MFGSRSDVQVRPNQVEAGPSGSQAKWKPGVKGREGIEFVKVQKCKGVVWKPDVQAEASRSQIFMWKPVQVEARCGSV